MEPNTTYHIDLSGSATDSPPLPQCLPSPLYDAYDVEDIESDSDESQATTTTTTTTDIDSESIEEESSGW